MRGTYGYLGSISQRTIKCLYKVQYNILNYRMIPRLDIEYVCMLHCLIIALLDNGNLKISKKERQLSTWPGSDDPGQ